MSRLAANLRAHPNGRWGVAHGSGHELERPLMAVKPVSRSQSIDGYGANSGLSRGDL